MAVGSTGEIAEANRPKTGAVLLYSRFGGFSMLLVVGLCTLLWTEDCSFLNLQSTCNPRIATLCESMKVYN